MNLRMIVPRVSRDETTFAVVEWAGVARDRLRQALRTAVTAWMQATPAGRAARTDAAAGFDIGDLSQVADEPSLRPFLARQGITYLNIDVYGDTGPAYGWTFDDSLVAAGRL